MKIWTISDLHVDYSENFKWVINLSNYDFKKDILIVAGDISDLPDLFEKTLLELRAKFHTVLFLPGNHDLWTKRHAGGASLEAYDHLQRRAMDCGVHTGPLRIGATCFVPLLGWYDYSFGVPSQELIKIWGDFRMCSWPDGFDPAAVTRHFTSLNTSHLKLTGEKIVTFSHFLPRIDLIPDFVPEKVKALFPVMGSTVLEEQIRTLKAAIHIYGHSHFNRDVRYDGVRYVNNALGYPYETRITRKRLLCLGDTD